MANVIYGDVTATPAPALGRLTDEGKVWLVGDVVVGADNKKLATIDDLNAKVSAVYRYQGTVDYYFQLPKTNEIGDVYNIKYASNNEDYHSYYVEHKFVDYTEDIPPVSEGGLSGIWFRLLITPEELDKYPIGSSLNVSFRHLLGVDDTSYYYSEFSVPIVSPYFNHLTNGAYIDMDNCLAVNIISSEAPFNGAPQNTSMGFNTLYDEIVALLTDPSSHGFPTPVSIVLNNEKTYKFEGELKVKDGDNVAWTGEEWDILGGSVDMRLYARNNLENVSPDDFKAKAESAGIGLGGGYTKEEINNLLLSLANKDLSNVEIDAIYELFYNNDMAPPRIIHDINDAENFGSQGVFFIDEVSNPGILIYASENRFSNGTRYSYKSQLYITSATIKTRTKQNNEDWSDWVAIGGSSDMSLYAKSDLSNVNNAVFKAKMESAIGENGGDLSGSVGAEQEDDRISSRESQILHLGDTVDEDAITSICDFELTPKTAEVGNSMSYTLFLPNGIFYGRELPLITTNGELTVLDADGNKKYSKFISEVINRRGVSDRITNNGVEKKWSKKFYLNKVADTYESKNGGINTICTWTFTEEEFVNTGIPAKLADIPMATTYFYNNSDSQTYINDRVYGGQPYPAKFSYDETTGLYTLVAKCLLTYNEDKSKNDENLLPQLTKYSKAYFYYQLETPYTETDLFALGLNAGDKITFTQDNSEMQDMIDNGNAYRSFPTGGKVTDLKLLDTTPTLNAEVPKNLIKAAEGMDNAAMMLNYGKTGVSIAQSYSWIGDGDESTDYTTQIQSKLDELHSISNGGIIYLGNGTYNISKSLIIYENISIIGTGDTIINQISDKTHGIIINGSNINIESLTIKLSGNCDGSTEHVLSKDFDSEVIGCIYVNSNNRKTNVDFDDRYPENLYCQHVTIRDVILIGTYSFKYEGNYYRYPDNLRTYKGCGIIGGKMFFNYLFADNIKMKKLYCGYYGTGGSNIINLFCTDCKIMVYDLGGGYNNFDIKGHSSYGSASDTETISISDLVVYSNGENNNYNVQVYDSQWFEYLLYFDGCSMQNKYNAHYFSGGYYGPIQEVALDKKRIKSFVYNVGRGNVNMSPYVNEPFHTGTVRYNLTGQSEFKDVDTTLYNVLAGAGIWGNISTTNSIDETILSLTNICRYPNNDHIVGSYLLFNETPSIENPIEIIIDVANRHVYAFPNLFIQFSHKYVASDFSITWYTEDDDEIKTVNVKDNTDVVYFYNLNQAGSYHIYKIKIVITKALHIPELKYRHSDYTHHVINYNENNKVGIINIGMVGDEFGRSFLGECGGSLYGDVTMEKGSKITGLPMPTEATDAATKEYVDSAVQEYVQATLLNGEW